MYFHGCTFSDFPGAQPGSHISLHWKRTLGNPEINGREISLVEIHQRSPNKMHIVKCGNFWTPHTFFAHYKYQHLCIFVESMSSIGFFSQLLWNQYLTWTCLHWLLMCHTAWLELLHNRWGAKLKSTYINFCDNIRISSSYEKCRCQWPAEAFVPAWQAGRPYVRPNLCHATQSVTPIPMKYNTSSPLTSQCVTQCKLSQRGPANNINGHAHCQQ